MDSRGIPRASGDEDSARRELKGAVGDFRVTLVSSGDSSTSGEEDSARRELQTSGYL